jgi:hypothetical protein
MKTRPSTEALRLILAVKSLEAPFKTPWEAASALREAGGRRRDIYRLLRPRTKVGRIATISTLLGSKSPVGWAASTLVFGPVILCLIVGLFVLPYGGRLLQPEHPLRFAAGIGVTILGVASLHLITRLFISAFTEVSRKGP